jgi:DNA-binding response OmpR family regulator
VSLVVDDRRDAVFLLKTLLTKTGHDVATAENGETGLEAVRRFAPHVVISNIALPAAMASAKRSILAAAELAGPVGRSGK